MIRRQIAHNNTCNFSGKDIPWLILKLLSGNEARLSLKFKRGVLILQATSGPHLVSRTGDVGWTKRTRVKEPKGGTHAEPRKGVDSYRQQDGGHGSRNPLRSV